MWKGHDKTLSTSKYILKVLVRLLIVVILYTFWITYETRDQQTLVVIAGGIMGLLTTAVGFYYWKAKSEKIIEYKKLEKELEIEVDRTETVEEYGDWG